MQTDNDKIKNIFSSKLTDFEADPPLGMWDRIAEKLPAETTPVRSKKTLLYKRIAFASTVAAAVVMSFLVLFNEVEKNKVLQIADNVPVEALAPSFVQQQQQIQNDTDRKELLSKEANSTLKGSASSANNSLLASSSDPVLQIDNIDPFAEIENNSEISDTIVDVENVAENTATDNTNRKTVDKSTLKLKIEDFANQGNSDVLFSEVESANENIKSGFSLSLAGNTGFSKDNSRTQVTNSLRSVYTYMDGIGNKLNDSELPTLEESEMPAKITHRQPISFGLAVSKDLTNKLSVETGIVYTYLSSKITNKGITGIKRTDSQYFNYWGIPVLLNYTFANLGKAEFYGSIGGMVQKDFYGRYKEEQVMFNENFDEDGITVKRKIHQRNPQFSALAKVGVSYPVFNKIHAYATVGGTYYFDAHNEYKTIYSDKKVQLDVNIGFKIKF